MDLTDSEATQLLDPPNGKQQQRMKPPLSSSPSTNASSLNRSLEWSALDKSKFFLFSPLINLGVRLLTHPANLLNTRVKAQRGHSLYSSPLDAFRKTVKNEGVKGLYKGFGLSSCMLLVHQVYVLSYEWARSSDRFLSLGLRLDESTRNGISAAISVFLIQILANPIDVMAQRSMVQTSTATTTSATSSSSSLHNKGTTTMMMASSASSGSVRAASTTTTVSSSSSAAVAAPLSALSSGSSMKASSSSSSSSSAASFNINKPMSAKELFLHVARTHGVKGFFSGFLISCAQFIPSASLWWSSYPVFRDLMLPPLDRLATRWSSSSSSSSSGEAAAAAAAAATTSVSSASSGVNSTTLLYQPQNPLVARASEVLAGGLASASVAVFMNPLDLVRCRVQTEGRGAIAVFKELIKEEGLRGMMKGTTSRMAMLIPQGALSIFAYELTKRLSMKEQGDGAKAAGLV